MKPGDYALLRRDKKLNIIINGTYLFDCVGVYHSWAEANAAKKSFAADGIPTFIRAYDKCDPLTQMIEPIR